MSLAAGSLNRRVTIQQLVNGQDAAGQPWALWSDVATVWANVAGATGLGTIKNAGDVAAAVKRYSIRIRFREGLDEGMRVLSGSATFDVKEVRMDHAGREWTDLVCESLGPDVVESDGVIDGGTFTNDAGTGSGSGDFIDGGTFT